MKTIMPYGLVRLFTVMLAALLLAACGGGGGGSDDSIKAAPSVNTLTVTQRSISPSRDGTTQSPATLNLSLTTPSGAPASGVVTFAVPSSITVGAKNAPIRIGTSGIATVKVFAKTAGTGVITTSYSSGGGVSSGPKVRFTSTVTDSSNDGSDTPQSPSFSVITLSPNNNITNAAPVEASVILTDANGGIMPGKIVTFAIDGGDTCSGCGQLSPASGSVLTDNNGVALITLKTGTTTGAAILMATYSSGGQNIGTSIGFNAVEAALDSGGTAADFTMSKLSFSDPKHKVSKAAPLTASVTVKDAQDKPVRHKVVTFTADAGVLSPATGKVLTNSNGEASITLLAGNTPSAGTLTATYVHGDKSVSQSDGFSTAGDGGSATASAITLNDLNVKVAGTLATATNQVKQGSDGEATVILKDSNEGILANKVVTFSTTAGVLVPASGSVQTDSDGVATIAIKAGSKGQEAAILTAVYAPASGSAVQASTAFTTLGDDDSGSTGSDYSLANMHIKVGGTEVSATNLVTATSPATATVDLTDPSGQLVKNQVVTFSTTAGGLSPSTGAVLTDGDGRATITLTAGDVATAGLLTASYSAANGATTKTSLGFQTKGDATSSTSAPTLTNLAVTSAGTNNEISASNPGTVSVTLSDASGNNMPGKLVTFSTTAGVMDPATGSVLTNNSSIATLKLLAGTIKTAGTITATYTDTNGNPVKASVGFSTLGDAPSNGNTEAQLSDVSITPVNIDAATPGQASVILTDAQGNGLPNKVITFTTTAGTLAAPPSGMALTNASGKATVTLKDNGIETAGILTATYTDASGKSLSSQTGFSLAGDGTNTANWPKLSDISLSFGGGQVGTANAPITASQPATVTIYLHKADGSTPIVGKMIQFSLGSGSHVGSLGGQSSALTGPSGEAIITLTAGTTQGAGTLTASYTDVGAGVDITRQKSFAVKVGGTGSGPVLSTPELLDASGTLVGTTANPITSTKSAKVSVTLTDGGTAIANKLISFELLGDVGQLDPATGTALTDGNGTATIVLKAGAKEGAGTLVASYSAGGNTITTQVDFTTKGEGAVTTQELSLGTLDKTTTPATFKNLLEAPVGLKVGSTVAIIADIVDVTDTANPLLYSDSPIEVTFTSSCFQGGNATFNPKTAISIDGHATTSYKSDNNACSSDSIQATAVVNSKKLTASTGSFDIEKSPPNAIEFLGANPAIIGIKGASAAGAKDTSTMTFRVMDGQGKPVSQGQKVNFKVNNPVGGFGFKDTTGTITQKSEFTDADGEVSVTVSAGTVPAVGTVEARLEDDLNTTAFDESTIYGTGTVSVQQGVATQDRFEIDIKPRNPPAGNGFGVTAEVSVRAADRYGNWVPNGTIVHFATKLGDIDAQCTVKDGGCSVTWTSHGVESNKFDSDRQNRACFTPNAAGNPLVVGDSREKQGLPIELLACGSHDRYGVNVITAWVKGEESFDDANGDNQYNTGEQFVDLSEIFQDYNLTGLYEAPDGNYSGEDFNNKGDADINHNGTHDGPNGEYNGLSCESGAVLCNPKLVNVRSAGVMVMSTDNIQMRVWSTLPPDLSVSTPTKWGDATLISSVPEITTPTSTITVVVADINGNAPPINTTIKVEPKEADTAVVKADVAGPKECTLGSSLGPLVCTFNLIGTTAGTDSGNKFIITASSGTDDPKPTVTRVLTVP